MTVIDSIANPKKSGILFRKARSGPEQDLVNWFLELHAVKPKRGECVTVFREPRLPTGFPDLVAVVWKESVISGWGSERRYLTSTDLRVMHHLVTAGPVELSDLKLLLGQETERSLDRLQCADMAYLRGRRWNARSLSKIFAVRRIVAIEAKITSWRSALDQAFINTWFTPESYILIPAIPKGAALVDTAIERGVGVLSKEFTHLIPQPLVRPRSYASWLFNEWTWRVAAL
jgi:hypothetical protein